jgi:hypothetical protein
MANPFGDKDQASKRPAHTIEGTATEVSVESGPEQERAGAAGVEEREPGEGLDDGASAGRADPHPPRPQRSGLAQLKSFMTHLAAGVVGGLIGVIGLALSSSDFGAGLKSAPAPEVAAVEQRLAALEAASPPAAPDIEALSALEGRIATLESAEKTDATKRTELADRVGQLDASLAGLAKAAEEGGSVPAAAATAQQIEEAERRLDIKLADALAKGEAANRTAIEEVAKAVAELRAKLGALAEAKFGTGDASASPELAAFTERLAKLEAMLPELAGAIDKEAAGAKSAALAIAFANLRAAVSDGRPYAAELDTIGTLAPALGDLGVLPGYAEKGIPTLLDLTRSFVPARDEALAAPAPEGEASLVGSLMASAESMVKIRRIDETPAGEGAEAALARAKSALDKGDLASAVKEVETLDDKARHAFSGWLGDARARLAAGETLTRLEGALLISMGGEAEATQP